MTNHSDIVEFIWKIADLLRGDYRPREYVDVILPLVVLRRLDQAIEVTRPTVQAKYERLVKGGVRNIDAALREGDEGVAVYNISSYDWQRLLEAHNDIEHNLVTYLNGFSQDVQEIIDKFDFRRQVQRLRAASDNLLYTVLHRFGQVDLHPSRITNHEMGDIFENLIRRFSEQYNETAGEYFTPREVIKLMVRLLFSEDTAVLYQPGLIRTIYDPACGTGGMLTEAKQYILDEQQMMPRHQRAEVFLYGQEINPTAYAVAKADMLLKGEKNPRIYFGNTFSDDGHTGERFHFMLSNPPYGVDWKKVEWVVKREHQTRGFDGRFGAGLPRVNDGSLLFLQHLISKMRRDEESRIAIVLNGSPLFTGEAGSGESEIRRWVIENDFLEGIVALPNQLFYNTSISTYIWLLTNRKSERRRGKVQLLNAVGFSEKLRKSKGEKRNEIVPTQIDTLAELYRSFADGEYCRVYPNLFFGYRKVRIDRPLRLNFQASPERIARLREERAFQQLVESKKVQPDAKAHEEELGRQYQQRITTMLAQMLPDLFFSRAVFEEELRRVASTQQIVLTAALRKAILAALSERDAEAEICRDAKGRPEPDLDLRDYEHVPLPDGTEQPVWHTQFDERVPLTESVSAYLQREVLPFVEEPIIDATYTDDHDGNVGKIGYEINFTRYFYRYEPPRPPEEIEAEIRTLEHEIVQMLRDVTG